MTAKEILSIIFKRRRLLESEVAPEGSQLASSPEIEEASSHINKIEAMIKENNPIEMILPAFPGKSPNRNKTLSRWPDLAEKHSIDNLHLLCEEIQSIYEPGAKITICSDGYVFSDLVRIPDDHVAAYSIDLTDYYKKHYASSFSFFDLKDAFQKLDCLDTMREELMIQYGESLVSLKDRSRTEKEIASMYLGITRFLYEDFLGLDEFKDISKAQVQKLAKNISYRVIQRSNAWGRLLENQFPDCLRLSIHPQYRVSNKIGIHMVATDDCWRTPWHSVAVRKNGYVYLEKRSEIDENMNRLIFQNGRPFCYNAIDT